MATDDTLSGEDYSEYLAELRETVCSRCVARPLGAPPCAPHGVACGIERHVPKLVSICRSTHSPLIDAYIDKLHDEICKECEFKESPACPCPLDYLIELAVEAIEAVENRRAGRLAKTVLQ
jgi:hypothetical protein